MTPVAPPVVTVGIDGSPVAQAALRWAARDAALRHARLRVVVAYDRALDAARVLVTPPSAEVPRMSCALLLDEAIRSAQIPESVSVEAVIRQGNASPVLVEAAAGSVLLAVGARGRGGFAGLRLGSVGHKCVQQARRPVVVVRGHIGTGGPVVCGLDGSPESEQALGFAADEARVRGLPLHVVHAVYWDLAGRDLIRPDDDRLRAWGAELVQATLSRVFGEAAPASMNKQIVVGHPADTLGALSRQATLLVVGTRGSGATTGTLLGSVAGHLLRHAECPVGVTGPTDL